MTETLFPLLLLANKPVRCIGTEKEINFWTKNRSKISPCSLLHQDVARRGHGRRNE
jgi:hypothetical protein